MPIAIPHIHLVDFLPLARPRRSHVVEVLDALFRERGLPKTIRCDNGPEFAGRVLDQWAFFNQVELDFSRPATPTATTLTSSRSTCQVHFPAAVLYPNRRKEVAGARNPPTCTPKAAPGGGCR